MDLLPEPLTGKITPGKIILAVVPRRAIQPLLGLAARLALHDPLRVLDGGNCFNAYVVAQILRPALLPALLAKQARAKQARAQQARQQTQEVEAALERIRVARAFTCYQMVTLLDETPATPVATLVLDLLATFRDETVPLAERQRLLEHCLERLKYLAAAAPLIVSASPDGGPPMSRQNPQRQPRQGDGLLSRLEQAADQVWRFSAPPPIVQLSLW